jgi:predicted MFS family arabinose efflux permease
VQAASRGAAAISGQTTRPTVADIAKEARLFASLDQSAFTNRHAWLYIVITLTHLTDGFDLLMIGVVLPGMVAAFKLTPPEAGFLVSSVFLGMTVGALTITYWGDLIGRKKALLICVARQIRPK